MLAQIECDENSRVKEKLLISKCTCYFSLLSFCFINLNYLITIRLTVIFLLLKEKNFLLSMVCFFLVFCDRENSIFICVLTTFNLLIFLSILFVLSTINNIEHENWIKLHPFWLESKWKKVMRWQQWWRQFSIQVFQHVHFMYRRTKYYFNCF